VTSRQSNLALVQSQIAALGPSPQLVAQAQQVGSLRQLREAALQDALSKRINWEVTFEQLSRVLPAGSWFSSLAVTSPTPSTSTSASSNPTGVTIQGYADSEDTVAQVLSRLALVPGLSNVTLANTSANTIGTKPIVQFNITAAVSAS
jgi:Tfp pilus assembly protein PilN